MIAAVYLGGGLERIYRQIERERMTGLPLLNSALSVKAVGFRDWQGSVLGVLVTPWFMNLVMLPGEGDEWGDLRPGSKVLHAFPSGEYEFIVGEEEGVGIFQSCSLFSPMFEFGDQRSAEMTAEAVMAGIIDAVNRNGLSTRTVEKERDWRGEAQPAAAESATQPSEAESLSRRLEQPVSRRELPRAVLPSDVGQ